jgi:hypothetical protein
MPFNLTGQQASSGHQPGTPTIGTATAGDGSATVTFTAPSYLGKPIGTTYTATSTPGGITGTGSSSPISITGLTNGISYTFKVKLSNSITSSLESNESNSVTPAGSFSVFGFTPTPPPTTTYYASGCCNVVGANPYATQALGTTSSNASINLADTCLDGYITNEQISTTGYPSVNCNPTPFSVFGFTPTPFSVFGFTPTPFSSDYSWLDGGTALAPDLTVKTSNDFLDSKNIDNVNIGEFVLTMDINTFSIHKTKVIETFNIESDLGILIDGDVFLPEFKILAKKDNKVEFISVTKIDTTYQKYSYLQNDFVDIFIVEEIDAPLASKILKCDKEYFFVGSSLISMEKYAK